MIKCLITPSSYSSLGQNRCAGFQPVDLQVSFNTLMKPRPDSKPLITDIYNNELEEKAKVKGQIVTHTDF